MNFVTELLNSVNQQVDHITFDGYHAISSMFSSTLTAMLVIYCAGLGWLVIRGLVPLTPMSAAWHIVKAAFIFTFALHWDYFSYFFQNFFLHGSDRLMGALLASTPGKGTDPATITQSLALFWEAGNNIFAGVWRASGPDFLLGNIMGLLGFAGVTGMTAVALFYIVMSKIALSVLLILAPVILPMFLWSATRGIFNAWLQLLVQWMITPLFLYAFLGIFLKIIEIQARTMAAAVNGPTTAEISAFVLLAVIVMAALRQASVISRHLAKKIEVTDSSTPGESVPYMALKALRQRGSSL